MATALACAALAVFYASPHLRVNDSKFTGLLSENLLRERSFALDSYFWPQIKSNRYPSVHPGQVWPRHVQPGGRKQPLDEREEDALRRANGFKDEPDAHLYYVYPPGTAILAVPFMAAWRLTGGSTLSPKGRFRGPRERRFQKGVAALWAGIATVFFFLLARQLLPRPESALIAATGALGTHVWSIASRSLQAHGTLVLLFSASLWLLVRAERDDRRLHPVLLATLISLAFWSRPTAVTVIIPLALYVLWRHPRDAPWLAGTGLAWLGLFLAYSQFHFNDWLPPYYQAGGFVLSNLGTGLAANLVSPSRSIFLYSPFLAVVVYGLIRYRRDIPHKGLLLFGVGSVAFHLVMVSARKNYWAMGYGPRFLTDIVPLFLLLAVLAWAATLEAQRRAPAVGRRRAWEGVALASTLIWSVAIHGAGATRKSESQWSRLPVSLREDPGRIFDWSQPQWYCVVFDQRGCPGLDLEAGSAQDAPSD